VSVARVWCLALIMVALAATGCGLVTGENQPTISCDPGATDETGIECNDAVDLVRPAARLELQPVDGDNVDPSRRLTITELRFRSGAPCQRQPGAERVCPPTEHGRALVVVVATTPDGGFTTQFGYWVRRTDAGIEIEAGSPIPYCAPPVQCDPGAVPEPSVAPRA
jgi:hypothetical protein